MPASNASLQTLSSKIIKSRNELHATRLKVETARDDCDKAKADVEDNDASISGMEEEEKQLQARYVDAKMEYERAYAEKYENQQALKSARQQKATMSKRRDVAVGSLEARRSKHKEAHAEHMKAAETAQSLTDRLEAIEKEKARLRRLANQHRKEADGYSRKYEELRRELNVVQASAAAV
jgi:chromosome segregation ATPase